jgi:hypothetical protein
MRARQGKAETSSCEPQQLRARPQVVCTTPPFDTMRPSIGAVYESEALSETAKEDYLDIDEIRLISDLRIMHAKIDELYGLVENLKRRHSESSIVEYADRQVLPENISRVDEIYMWFVKVKEEMERRNGELD